MAALKEILKNLHEKSREKHTHFGQKWYEKNSISGTASGGFAAKLVLESGKL